MKLAVPLAFVAALLPAVASAQSYRCTAGSTTYLSDRPCPETPSTRIRSYGNPRGQYGGTYVPPPRPAGRMEEHVKYLSPECASISEAIRTAPARGVGYGTVQDLQNEYAQKCQLDDREARRQKHMDDADQARQQQAPYEAAAAERKRNQARSEQCVGMRDVIATKRARESALNEQEVTALRSLEKTYNERCLVR